VNAEIIEAALKDRQTAFLFEERGRLIEHTFDTK